MLIDEATKRKLVNIQFIDSVPKKEVFKYILASDFGMSVLKKVDTFKTIYSNKTFDYMACKTPLFLLIDGVSRKLVEEAKCGVYVEPENPGAFAAAIATFSQKDEREIREMGQNGFDFAKLHFDRDVLAKRYIKYLIDVQSIKNILLKNFG